MSTKLTLTQAGAELGITVQTALITMLTDVEPPDDISFFRGQIFLVGAGYSAVLSGRALDFQEDLVLRGVVTSIELFSGEEGLVEEAKIATFSFRGGCEFFASDLPTGLVAPDGGVTFDAYQDLFALLSRAEHTTLGTSSDEVIQAGGGAEIVRARAGDDLIQVLTTGFDVDGGKGVDTLDFSAMARAIVARLFDGIIADVGGGRATADNVENANGSSFDDRIFGNGRANEIAGGKGNDEIEGGAGADMLRGNAGADSIDGGGGKDSIFGDAGADSLTGAGSSDVLNGGSGRDTLEGGAGKDTLNGGAGSDDLKGGAQADQLNGGGGRDTLDGGAGADTLTGGKGADTFLFTATGGKDCVTDFELGRDVVQLQAGFDLSDVSIRRGDDFIRLLLRDGDGAVVSTTTFKGDFEESVVLGDFFGV